MKYYESSFEEYIHSVSQHNLHPELEAITNNLSPNIDNIDNLIIYGAVGTGKYSQALNILKNISPSRLKYDKKIVATTDKQQYTYRISDIHYEIDMALLGCNSKTLWHEIFFQIVDIISVKPKKVGIILCKNFHAIHSELLETFYSYMQQFNHSQSNIVMKFFLITENLSFIPNKILKSCSLLNIKRPTLQLYESIASGYIQPAHENVPPTTEQFLSNITNTAKRSSNNQLSTVFNVSAAQDITNIKDLRVLNLSANNSTEVVPDLFNTVCDKIIRDTYNIHTIEYTDYRDSLYNMLTYNLDVSECLWYIVSHFIDNDQLDQQDISDIIEETYSFFKYFNNNYRPIYHLESIMFYIINRLEQYK
jgi:hypothetical protein